MTRRHDCPCCECCINCGVNTAAVGDQYMLRPDIWHAVALDDELLCVPCFERRVGRKLRLRDFGGAPTNIDNPTFLRLLDELYDAVTR